jgi:RimJ/RimL family protein N-acetyltransferase
VASGSVRRIPSKEEERRRLAQPPAPYPEGNESDVILKDGTPLHLRPIRPDEGPALLRLYDRLSDESLYQRFFVVPAKDAAKADYLAHVDYVDQFAIVALKEEEIVAVARYHRQASRPDHAEVAFTVADELQGKGIGSLLFAGLARIAREHGVSVFDAEVLTTNAGMIRVFEKSGCRLERRTEGDRYLFEIGIAEKV